MIISPVFYGVPFHSDFAKSFVTDKKKKKTQNTDITNFQKLIISLLFRSVVFLRKSKMF